MLLKANPVVANRRAGFRLALRLAGMTDALKANLGDFAIEPEDV